MNESTSSHNVKNSYDFSAKRSPDGTGVSSTAPNRSSGGIQHLKNNPVSIPKEKQFKVIIVGDSMVGKTSLIQRFTENKFKDHNTLPTLSTDFKVNFWNFDVLAILEIFSDLVNVF